MKKPYTFEELGAFFGGNWRTEKPFKGSSAQKKNALKEYYRMLEERRVLRLQKEKQEQEEKEALKEKLQKDLIAAEWSLEHSFRGFWWEVLPMDAYDKCLERIRTLKKQIEALSHIR